MKISIISASVLTVLLAGCSSSHSPSFEDAHSKSKTEAERSFEDRTKDLTPVAGQIGQIHRGIKYHDVNNYSLVDKDIRKLPKAFDSKANIKDRQSGYTVDDFAALLFEAHGIILDVSSPDLWLLAGEDIAEIRSKKPSQKNGAAVPSPADSNVQAFPAVSADATGDYAELSKMLGAGDSSYSGNGMSRSRQDLKLKRFSYTKGSIKEMLDYVSIMNGLKWRYDPSFKRAYLYAYDTKEFFIHDFARGRDRKSQITSGSSQKDDSGGNAKTNRQYSETEKFDAWKNITDTIDSMLSGAGGSASYDQKTGMVMVSDNDQTLSRINNYVDKMNKLAGTEVVVQYRMMRVTYKESDFKGMNQSFLNEKMNSGSLGNFSMKGGLGEFSSDPYGNAGSLASATGGNMFAIANSQFEILMGILNSVGTTTISYQTHANIRNNESFNHQGGRTKQFIDEVTKQSYREGGGEDNITFKKGDATDGVHLSLTPRIANDRIMIDYSVVDSDITGFEPAGLGNGLEAVTLKGDAVLSFQNSAVLKNGETRVLQVFEESTENTDAQGPIDHALWFLGGKESRDKEKTAIVVTLSAYYNP